MAHFDESDDFNYEAQSSESYDAKEIGRRIKLARKARRISQKELAEMLNRSLRTIQKYESGDIEVSVAALVSVCQAAARPAFVSGGSWDTQGSYHESCRRNGLPVHA